MSPFSTGWHARGRAKMQHMNPRGAARIVMIVLGIVAVFSVGGLIATAVAGVFGDRYGAYGEVPIPGSATVRLPAGEVTASFHVKGYGGRGLTVPPLRMNITPPQGGADPEVTEDLGATVSVNDDARRRVWVMQVPAEGLYRISVDGPVNGYVDPRLALGSGADTRITGLMWVFVALSIISVDLVIAVWWFRRKRSRTGPGPATGAPEVLAPLADPYTPTDQGVRLEQLKTIAALRDSGALTEREFEEEKRRILDGR